MDKLTGFFLILLIIVLSVSSYLIYDNLPRQAEQLSISNLPELPPEIQNTYNIKQFYPNIRFNHNAITYSFEAGCDANKIQQMTKAFNIISNGTGIITFSESSQDPDISISCSKDSIEKEKNIFVAGEGGPKEFINSTIYPVILKGQILLYSESNCKEPIVELHELLHVFGFDHINDPKSIMYPYSNCNQKINPEYFDYLKKLYSIEPKAELKFEEANATKGGKYLSFEIFLLNSGLIDAKNVSLIIEANGEDIRIFELGDIKLGTGKRFYVQNLMLPARSVQEIRLKLTTDTPEFDTQNNIITAKIA